MALDDKAFAVCMEQLQSHGNVDNISRTIDILIEKIDSNGSNLGETVANKAESDEKSEKRFIKADNILSLKSKLDEYDVKKLLEQTELKNKKYECAGSAINKLNELQEKTQSLVSTIVGKEKDYKTMLDNGKEIESNLKIMNCHIRRLDVAKRNLITSMNVLKRLQMLVTAYEKLTVALNKKRYKQCAPLVQAVHQLMQHFKPFRNNPQIAALSRDIAHIEMECKKQAFEMFYTSAESLDFSARPMTLSQQESFIDAAILIDALGDESQDTLINWYCRLRLEEYQKIFQFNEEARSLNNISRRFAWLHRILDRHNEIFSTIFPAHWKVNCQIAKYFCQITRNDFDQLLKRDAQNFNAVDLLTAMKATLAFENQLDKMFETKKSSLENDNKSILQTTFLKSISGSFQVHSSIFLSCQKQTLEAMIVKYRSAPNPFFTAVPIDEGVAPVLSSAAEIFIYFRDTLAQSANFLDNKSIRELGQVFAFGLSEYSRKMLNYQLEKPQVCENFSSLAMILNTADYMRNITNQLEEQFSKISISKYTNEQASYFNEQQDLFIRTSGITLKIMIATIADHIEPSIQSMQKMDWSRIDDIRDQTYYCTEIASIIKNDTKQILVRIENAVYARAFCDKLVDGFVNLLATLIFRLKPISEVGAEQLLLDIYSLKKVLLDIINVRSDLRSNASYHRFLNTSIAKIESILKVVLTQTQPYEGLVQNYLYTIGDRSEANFCKILDIKGIRKSEQQELLKTFRAKLSDHPDLVESSAYLSGLSPQSMDAVFSSRLDASSLMTIFSAARDGLEIARESTSHTATEISEKLPFSNIRRFFSRKN